MGANQGLRQPIEIADGVHTYQLTQWSEFHDFIERVIFQGQQATRPTYIWRGQRDSEWSLSSTLDRLFEQLGPGEAPGLPLEDLSARHLQTFKLATRGRRGANPAMLEEPEWWALGQHFGLATPLLDWTRSPYAAAYFAFEKLKSPASGCRAVYGLDVDAVGQKNAELADGPSLESGRPPLVQVPDSLSNENPRLVSQGGLFTRAPIGMPIELWVSESFEEAEVPVLLKVLLPDEDRIACLRNLDRMNINHASLFPDLAGASRATNLRFELYPELLRS